MDSLHLAVLGWYGHHNVGDEAYKIAFNKVFPEHFFHFANKLAGSSLANIVLGGGNVVSDYFIQQVPAKSSKHAISVGITSDSPVASLSQFNTVIVRDVRSLALLASHGIKAQLMPDLTFSLEPSKKKGREYLERSFKLAGADLYSKVVAVVFNSYLLKFNSVRGHTSFLKFASDMVALLDGTMASFVFVPFGREMPFDDRVANAWIASQCKWHKKNYVVYDYLSVHETLDLIAACDATISTRLHGNIFSCIGGAPFIDVYHHDKSLGFTETIGRSGWSVEYWNLDLKYMKSLLEGHLNSGTRTDDITYQQRKLLLEVAASVRFN